MVSARESQGRAFELDAFLEGYGEHGRGLFERNEAGELIDPWGTPLFVEESTVQSAGRDREFGTDDDISLYASRTTLNVRSRVKD
jgi:hypothetical protein